MKYLKYLFILFLALGCQKINEKHVAIGTWYRCNEFGDYWEYKITDQYTILPESGFEDVGVFKNEFIDSVMILSEYKNGMNLMINNDTFITISKSKNKVVLRSIIAGTTLELNKGEFDYDPIDSSNLKSWKEKILLEFKKREMASNCPKYNKPIPELNLDEEVEGLDDIIITEEKQ